MACGFYCRVRGFFSLREIMFPKLPPTLLPTEIAVSQNEEKKVCDKSEKRKKKTQRRER